MKTLSLIFLMLFGLNISIAKDSLAEATIKVSGNCEMCKKTIELAAWQKGVKTAQWNKETKTLFVKYSPSKITLEQIETNVAKSGYDTEHVKASDTTYGNIHQCCQYPRESEK
jgi:copper chaperone CopZ